MAESVTRDWEAIPVHAKLLILKTACGMLVIFAVACAAPGSALNPSAEQSPSCDVKKAKKVLYDDENASIPPELEDELCAKARPEIEKQEKAEKQRKEDKGATVPPPSPSPDYFAEGIFGEQETSELPPSPYDWTTLWRGVIDGQNVAVWAGSTDDDPSHGLVWVWVVDPYTYERTDDAYYDAPIPGPLRITDASNPDIYVVSDSTGETATFDARTRKWK